MPTKIENKALRDVMTRGVITIPMSFKTKDIARLLCDNNVSAAVVVSPDGEAMGVISGTDMIELLGKDNWENMDAESIMTPNLEYINADSTLLDAANVMKEKRIHRLLILSENGVGASQRPVGIISTSDIVKEISKT